MLKQNEDGSFTAIQSGRTNMCINSDGVSECVYVTVNEIPVKEITSESKKYSGTVGNIVTIKVNAKPLDSIATINWS